MTSFYELCCWVAIKNKYRNVCFGFRNFFQCFHWSSVEICRSERRSELVEENENETKIEKITKQNKNWSLFLFARAAGPAGANSPFGFALL